MFPSGVEVRGREEGKEWGREGGSEGEWGFHNLQSTMKDVWGLPLLGNARTRDATWSGIHYSHLPLYLVDFQCSLLEMPGEWVENVVEWQQTDKPCTVKHGNDSRQWVASLEDWPWKCFSWLSCDHATCMYQMLSKWLHFTRNHGVMQNNLKSVLVHTIFGFCLYERNQKCVIFVVSKLATNNGDHLMECFLLVWRWFRYDRRFKLLEWLLYCIVGGWSKYQLPVCHWRSQTGRCQHSGCCLPGIGRRGTVEELDRGRGKGGGMGGGVHHIEDN